MFASIPKQIEQIEYAWMCVCVLWIHIVRDAFCGVTNAWY